MPDNFNSFGDFAKFLSHRQSSMLRAERAAIRASEAGLYTVGNLAEAAADRRALQIVGKLIRKTARDKLGEYQPEASPFIAWQELADSTKADRVNQGFTENEPLLRTGDLRDSIRYKTDGSKAVYIGSDSDIAEYQELGTKNIPPRSFLGSSLAEKKNEVIEIIGKQVFGALIGKEVYKESITLIGEDD